MKHCLSIYWPFGIKFSNRYKWWK